ncbi:hypothetical protein LTS08_007019 [Lithohypha guttulata]|uniref:uncharacterized protein n=1 Tax=Lithohypha guttulata TaxID=1690604 RepID=UPI002DE007BC|nr:hypothetical protein LTR51_002069 [Lithohypha guttulata]KAK5097604.1 hypothetical protein LTS08_007019 [Lithohypha guttulata]
MPELASTRKTTTDSRKDRQNPKARDVGRKGTTIIGPATIQDRILKWQSVNETAAVDPDALSFCRTPVRQRSPSAEAPTEQHSQSTPRRRSTKWVQQQNQAWVKKRRSTRGDQKNTSNQKSAQSVPKPESPPQESPHDTSSQQARNVNSSRAEREERRKRRREARARVSGENALVEDGIRVYANPESRLASEINDAGHASARSMESAEGEEPSVSEHVGRLNIEHNGILSSEQDRPITHQAQPSRYAQTLGRSPLNEETAEQPKTRKRAVLIKTREILTGRNDLPPAPTNRIPSIEAWLDDQPHLTDPFVDAEPVITPLPSDIPKPLKHRSGHKKASVKPSEPPILEVENPNKIWDAISPPSPLGVRDSAPNVSRRLFSFEVCDDSSKGVNSAPPQPDNLAQGNHHTSNTRLTDERSTRRRRERKQDETPPQEKLSPADLNRQDSIQPDRDISPKKSQPSIPVENFSRASKALEQEDVDIPPLRPSSRGLKRKLTTHEDLLSVLSQPRATKSTRSMRDAAQPQTASTATVIHEAMRALQEEEPKYTRELRTLVDGVTPVLLQSLLSKADAAATAGLFSDNRVDDASFTRPIIDMGVALQRLKNLHHRIPLRDQDVEGLLTWAVTAHKSYSDYVKAWKLGFQDVIVNLAPLHDAQSTGEDMLARDIDGDAMNEQGQKVDVAYLQKRPLVRIKRMYKIFTSIQDAMPNHEKANKVANMFADLTERAKQRHGEEQGRLEDEAAAAVDPTKVRDIKTMAPLHSVVVDKKRKVRARDYFDLSVYHSTGQRLDCKIEIVLRDDPLPGGNGGDILICHVEEESKWLLFQPIQLTNVSSRRDHAEDELVLMVKGVAGIGTTWLELLALRAENSTAATEWLHMLGSNPLPSKLNHSPSWHVPIEPQCSPRPFPASPKPLLNAAALANLPSDIDVPIGEPSVVLTRRPPQAKASDPKQTERNIKLSMGGGLQKRSLPEHYHHAVTTNQTPTRSPLSSPGHSVVSAHARDPSVILRSSRKTDIRRGSTNIHPEPLVPQQQYSSQTISQQSHYTTSSAVQRMTRDSTKQNNVEVQHQQIRSNIIDVIEAQQSRVSEPLMSGALNSDIAIVTPDAKGQNATTSQQNPSEEVPHSKHSRTKSSTPLTETIREQWASITGLRRKPRGSSITQHENRPTLGSLLDNSISSRPSSRHEASTLQSQYAPATPPPPPVHGTPYNISSSPKAAKPAVVPWTGTDGVQAIGKPEHQASSDESGTESESDETDATSEMSEDDFRSELKDEPTSLVNVKKNSVWLSHGGSKSLSSPPSTGAKTLDPSDSASNGPYRRAPPPSSFPAYKKKRTIAMVCSWSDRGVWEPIQEDECSIVISPGLVQAFPMSAAHSQPMNDADWEMGQNEAAEIANKSPLVEFELTPIVPLRKGTALDITIRSPPTLNSTIRTTSNIMFRSRTVQECEKLYQLINWARCNNLTYAQLARSRAREQSVRFVPDAPQTRTRSWFSFGSKEKSSYRASSRPPTSLADTATSGNSATSAFSALKKFGMNSPFSINRSSVIRRPGFAVTGDSLYSSSNSGIGSGASTPVPASQAGFIPGPDGPNVPQTSAEAANGGGMVNNMKIRLFVRQGQKWEALGQCLLTVLPAAITVKSQHPTPGTSTTPRPYPPSAMVQPRGQHYRLPSSGSTPHRLHGDGREKRILITAAKRKDVVLLDETLGESCFEKVMQTGIALNVWKEDEEINQFGGVMTGRSRTYMIQFRTSMEASWVFNMCGTYRYGTGPA